MLQDYFKTGKKSGKDELFSKTFHT